MATDVKIQAVYDRVKNLKQRFYETKTQEEWDECKKELVTVLDEAKGLMTSDFFPKYKQGVVDSVAKMWTFKEKYFQQQGQKKQYQPKVTYLLQPELAEALTKYIQLKTAVLASEYEGRLNVLKEKECC